MPVSTKQLTKVPFAQKPKLTELLKNLVRSYPKGVGIVHEFIQNADDAGAKSVWVVLDERDHAADRLPSEAMASLQGPALVVFNDAVFSNDDWERIQSTGKSGKALDASKTGRFGLGFNSVYNVTDCPGVLTRDRLGFFDPHGSVIEGATRDEPGAAWILDQDLWQECADLLTVFKDFGLSHESESFDGTVFRLPLRTTETARSSEICQQAFTPANFDALVKKLVRESGELLLFLKNLLSVRVSRISPSGDIQEIVTIRTGNMDEVVAARASVHGKLAASHAEVLALLEESEPESLLAEYDHKVVVDRPGEKPVEQTWSIVQGLIAGPNDELVLAARGMNDYEEKAVPLVGAAALVNSTLKTSQADGRLFCTLPLASVSSFLPFHINGFFDLQSDRQGVFSDTGAEGKDAVRVEWNTKLLKHGCARVAALLLARIGERGPRTAAFYDFWPEVPETSHTLLQSLPGEVYEHLHQYPCVSCGSDKRMVAPGDVRMLPSKQHQVRQALLADDMPVPSPNLPRRVVEGFDATTRALHVMSPEDVRDKLRVSEDTDCPLAEAELESLQKKEWVVALMAYCCSDEDLDDFSGVPLALTADGKLHAFGMREAGPVYIAGQRERKILSSRPDLFLDEDLQRTPQLVGNRMAEVEEMMPTELVAKLPEIIDSLGDEGRVEWDPKVDGLPSEKWLTELFSYLADNAENCTLDTDILETLPLVPDQFGALWPMCKPSTPLLPAATRAQSRLIEALKPFRVPVVDGSQSLVKQIRRFEEAFEGEAIWRITGRDLVDTLSAIKDGWEESVKTFSLSVHGVLLSFLSTAEAIRSITSGSASRAETLKALPLFPTRDGQLVSLKSANVYLPAGFELPSIDADLGFLDTGLDKAWLHLLEAMDVPQLTRATLVRTILLPRYGEIERADQLHALNWLRTQLEEACNELGESEEASFRSELESAKLVLCTDGQLREGRALYEPEAEAVVGSLLGDIVGFPDMTVYHERKSGWLRLFKQLGMETQPRPEDLLAAVDDAMASAESSLKVAVATLERIARYLSDQWGEIRDLEVNDAQQDGSSDTWAMVDALSCRAWLPALQEAPRGFPRELFEAPAARLYKPNALYAREALDLVSMVHAVSEFDLGRMGNDIGLTHHAGSNVLAVQLDGVVAIVGDEASGFKIGNRTIQLLRNIYRQLGHLFPPLAETTDEFESLREKFLHKPCIIDEGGRLWKPTDSFAEAVPFFLGRRVHVRSKFNDTDRGLSVLGRRDAPSASDFKRFFEDVDAEQNEQNEQNEQTLDESMSASLRLAYRRAATIEDPEDLLRSAPVLTGEGFLEASEEVVIDDAEWLSDRARKAGLSVLDSELDMHVAQAFGVQSLSKAVFERPCQKTPCTDGGLSGTCEVIEKVIRAEDFVQGLRRLIRANHVTERSDDLAWLNELRLEAVDVLVSELVWQDSSEAIEGSEGKSDVLFDPDNTLIVISKDAGEVLHERVASVIAHELAMDGYSVDTMALATMLRTEPSRIAGVLTRLRIPQFFKDSEVDFGEAADEGGFIDEVETDVDSAEEDILEEDADDRVDKSIDSESEDTADDEVEADGTNEASTSHGKSTGGSGGRTSNSQLGHKSSGERDEPLEDDDDDEEIVDHSGDGKDATGAGTPSSGSDSSRSHGGLGTSPSRRPSTGRSRSRSSSGQNRRAVTYAAPKTEASEGEDPAKQEHRSRVDQAAVDLVLRYEEEQGRQAESMPHLNPGYDVESHNRDGELERYIEVKGLSSAWTDYGVGVSPRQIDKCRELSDAFWLYVVEFALEPSRARVYAIRNPVTSIDEYRFDGGWKTLATERSGVSTTPREGLRVILDGTHEGVIKAVKHRGVLKSLHIVFDDGTTKDVVFPTPRIKVLASEDID